MVKRKHTSIAVSRELWKLLNSKKEVGESFDKLLRRLIGEKNQNWYNNNLAPRNTRDKHYGK